MITWQHFPYYNGKEMVAVGLVGQRRDHFFAAKANALGLKPIQAVAADALILESLRLPTASETLLKCFVCNGTDTKCTVCDGNGFAGRDLTKVFDRRWQEYKKSWMKELERRLRVEFGLKSEEAETD
jgi:hypothetical protein